MSLGDLTPDEFKAKLGTHKGWLRKTPEEVILQ